MTEKKMTMGSLFDGSGGFPLVARECGIEPVWASEIEPYPIKVTTANFPDMRHLGDVSKIKGNEIEPVDIITFGSPCFAAGTKIRKIGGVLTPIEQIKAGDYVLTHKNRYRKVTDTAMTGVHKTVRVKAAPFPEIIATPNHKFYTRKIEKTIYSRKDEKKFSKPEWKRLDDMTENDYIGVLINKENENIYNLSDYECFLLGRYLAAGKIEGNSVVFPRAKGDPEPESLDELKDIVEVSEKEYRVRNSRLLYICKQSGKTFADFILKLPVELLMTLLSAYRQFTGYVAMENNVPVYHVVSDDLEKIYGLAECMLKVCRKPYAVRETEKGYELVDYIVENAEVDGDYMWYPVESIEDFGEREVYNITVSEDHSYIANGIVVKNCQDLSVAGLQKGMKHSHIGDDEATRSGLFFEAMRIIKEMREATNGEYPTYILWENVVGAYSSNNGEDFRKVLEEIESIAAGRKVHVPRPGKSWSTAGSILGDRYSIAWRTLDAQYWGVPQRRRRVFLVADFGGNRAEKILFERDGLQRHIEQSGEKE